MNDDDVMFYIALILAVFFTFVISAYYAIN